jgi:hypothetical protein
MAWSLLPSVSDRTYIKKLPLVFSVFCAEKTSGSEIAMSDRMQMYNIITLRKLYVDIEQPEELQFMLICR